MSIEDVKGFFVAITKDPVLAEKVKEAGTDLDAILKLGKENGYEFTPEDLIAVHDEMGEVGEELSDEQLEQVAGGFVSATAAAVVAGVAGTVSFASSVATAAHA